MGVFRGEGAGNIENNHFEHVVCHINLPGTTKDVKSAIKSETACAHLC